MTVKEIQTFSKDVLGITIPDWQAEVVQALVNNDHLQLTRAYGKSTAARIAREIIKRKG